MTGRDGATGKTAAAVKPPVTAGDLEPGVVIAVPAGAAGRQRPFCLRITEAAGVSQATGAVDLIGDLLRADGTTSRRIPLTRAITVHPALVTIVRRPATTPAAPVCVDVQPSRTQLAVMHIPAAVTVRLRRWDAAAGDWVISEDRDDDHPMIVVMPGDFRSAGWVVWRVRYGGLAEIRGGHHKRDRAVWTEAVRRIRDGGVVYIQREQQACYGRLAWVVTGVIDGPPLPGRDSRKRPGWPGPASARSRRPACHRGWRR